MKPVKVIRPDGQVGTIVGRIASELGAPQVAIAFADGAPLVVPFGELIRQDDGSYVLPREITQAIDSLPADAAAEDELVIPVVAEELTVEKQRVARGTVRVHKRVATREEIVDEPTIREEIVVEHIHVNAIVEGDPPQPHEEGDVLVIPILEEVLVVERRLLLREQVRVSRRRTTISNPQRVTLQREFVEIERIPAEPGAIPPPPTQPEASE